MSESLATSASRPTKLDEKNNMYPLDSQDSLGQRVARHLCASCTLYASNATCMAFDYMMWRLALEVKTCSSKRRPPRLSLHHVGRAGVAYCASLCVLPISTSNSRIRPAPCPWLTPSALILRKPLWQHEKSPRLGQSARNSPSLEDLLRYNPVCNTSRWALVCPT